MPAARMLKYSTLKEVIEHWKNLSVTDTKLMGFDCVYALPYIYRYRRCWVDTYNYGKLDHKTIKRCIEYDMEHQVDNVRTLFCLENTYSVTYETPNVNSLDHSNPLIDRSVHHSPGQLEFIINRNNGLPVFLIPWDTIVKEPLENASIARQCAKELGAYIEDAAFQRYVQQTYIPEEDPCPPYLPDDSANAMLKELTTE